ncbi:MAG TPA: nucleoside recognition domain-containing protein [Candidatus Eisenbacteria bacterium]|nr:nucleoside recognition domain-containing protein [Candidatus Eisenbacteria bacterium]
MTLRAAAPILRAMLNWIWAAFFLIAFAVAVWQAAVGGKPEVMQAVVAALFDSSKTAFEIALGLTGVMTLWLGLMKIAEKAGITEMIAAAVGPLFRRLFPGIPQGHPASGAIVMNRSANMLGLDNAATPLGLKAMKELQSLNPEPERATNDMVLFMVMNASSVTLVPISIMTFRAQLGAANPADVFVPILIATYIADISGLLLVASIQKLNLFNGVVLAWLGALTLAVGGLVWYFAQLPHDAVAVQSAILANAILIGLIASFLIMGAWRKLPMYETFIDGAKEGFTVAVGIIPYLVAILVAVGCLRASGVLEAFLGAIKTGAANLSWDTRWVDAMPTALIKPLSGGGARGMMVETMKTLGADSFAGRLSCVIQGSTETTFYVLAVYFGSVGVKKTRHALPCALASEVFGVLAAIGVTYLFFGAVR